MKYLLPILAAMLAGYSAMAASAVGTLGERNSQTIAGYKNVDLVHQSGSPAAKQLVVISTTNVDLAAANYDVSPFRRQTASYVVPSGRSLRVQSVKIQCLGTGAFVGALMYGDTDTGLFSNTDPTNPVYEYAATFASVRCTGTDGSVIEHPSSFLIPTGKYVYMRRGAGTGSITAWLIGTLE